MKNVSTAIEALKPWVTEIKEMLERATLKEILLREYVAVDICDEYTGGAVAVRKESLIGYNAYNTGLKMILACYCYSPTGECNFTACDDEQEFLELKDRLSDIADLKFIGYVDYYQFIDYDMTDSCESNIADDEFEISDEDLPF